MLRTFGRTRCAPVAVGDLLAAGLFAALFVVIAWTFRDYGVSFDEGVQEQYGHYVLDWYLTLGQSRNALTYSDLYYYGGAFDLVAAILERISPFTAYETRHLLNGLIGLLGVVGCWRFGRLIAGPTVGAASAFLLVLMPSWYGMMFIDPKDIPFAVGMIWGLYYIGLAADRLPSVPWSIVIRLGLVIGLALGIRVGAVLLFAYLGFVLALHVLTNRPETLGGVLREAVRLGAAVLIPTAAVAWLMMLVFWPYAQVNPVSHPLESLQHFATYSPDIDTLFFGRAADDHYRPLLYLPVYILIKLPEVHVLLVAVAAALATIAAWQVRQGTPVLKPALLVLAIVLPIVYVLISRPELYDAERHFLFVLPPLAIACAVAMRAIVIRLLPRAVWALAVVALVIAGGIVPARAMRDLHPYEYAYFNAFAGGLPGARGEFETEYWGSSLTEAARILAARLHDEHSPQVRVAVCGNDTSVEEPLKGLATVVDDWKMADFIIAWTRDRCDEVAPGRTIAEVSRDGVPFAVVKDVRGEGEQLAGNSR